MFIFLLELHTLYMCFNINLKTFLRCSVLVISNHTFTFTKWHLLGLNFLLTCTPVIYLRALKVCPLTNCYQIDVNSSIQYEVPDSSFFNTKHLSVLDLRRKEVKFKRG